MSQENVEIVCRLVEAARARDFARAGSELHPDAEWHNTAVFPGPSIVHGPRAIRAFWQDLFEAYGNPSDSGMEIEQIADADDVVVVLIHAWARGTGSGAPVDSYWAQAVRFQDGKVVRVEVHGRYDKALEAVGLSE